MREGVTRKIAPRPNSSTDADQLRGLAVHPDRESTRERGTGPLARALLLVALAAVGVRFLDAILGALDVFADYGAYYRAAANLRAGGDLYAEGRLLAERNDYTYWLNTNGQYVYPPLLALVLVPLTILDDGKAGVIWLLALALAPLALVWLAARVLGRLLRAGPVAATGLLLLTVVLLLLGRKYPQPDRFLATLTALAALAFLACVGVLRLSDRRTGSLTRPITLSIATTSRDGAPATSPLPQSTIKTAFSLALPILGAAPLLLSLRYGQIDLVLLLLTTGSLLAFLGGREALAGVALGAAAAVKPTLALYGLFYLRKGRWKVLVAAALTGLLLGLGPFALLPDPRAALTDWLAIAHHFGGDYLTYPSNQSARGFLLRTFAGGPRHTPILDAPPLANLLWLALAGVVLALWWRSVSCEASRAPGGHAPLEWGATAVLMLLLAPLSEDVHYVALLFPLALLGERIARGRRLGRPATLLAFAAPLYFAQPWLDFAYNRGAGDWSRLLASGTWLYGLLLTGAALALLLRRHSPDGR